MEQVKAHKRLDIIPLPCMMFFPSYQPLSVLSPRCLILVETRMSPLSFFA